MNGIRQSEQINELAAALVKLQGEIGAATKGSDNPYFKSKYADLAAIREAARPHLLKNGLAIPQMLFTYIDGDNVYVGVTTRVQHASGQWMESDFMLRPTKNDPQAFGSAATYVCRYTLAPIVGLSLVDDDGEGAMDRGGDHKTAVPPKRSHVPEKGTPKAVTAKVVKEFDGEIVEPKFDPVKWGKEMADILETLDNGPDIERWKTEVDRRNQGGVLPVNVYQRLKEVWNRRLARLEP